MNEQELQEKVKLQQKILEIEKMAKLKMTNEAISRYGNLKSAYPEKALQVAALIAQLSQENQINEQITDEQFKQLLLQLDSPRRETKIIRM